MSKNEIHEWLKATEAVEEQINNTKFSLVVAGLAVSVVKLVLLCKEQKLDKAEESKKEE